MTTSIALVLLLLSQNEPSAWDHAGGYVRRVRAIEASAFGRPAALRYSAANETWDVLDENVLLDSLPEAVLRRATSVAQDPISGTFFVLDARAARIVRVAALESSGPVEISSVPIGSGVRGEPRAIAYDPAHERIFLFSPSVHTLYELSPSGALVGTRDLAPFRLRDPRAMTFAPSGDTTDDPAALSLYVADVSASEDGTASARILEFSLTPPTLSNVAVQAVQSSLVQTIDTSRFSPPSPDPSGIAYHPGRNHLVMSDGEVDEMSIWAGANVFEFTLSGTLIETASTMVFSNEPTGVAYAPGSAHWFFSDDSTSQRRVFEVDPGTDGRVGTSDDLRTSFSTAAFGSNDPEGIAYDAGRGHLYVADGVNAEIYTIRPGANGRFDGIPPGGDDVVSQFDTAVFGLPDPESVEYNPDNDTLFLSSSGGVRKVVETTLSGSLVREYDISFLSSSVNLAGLAYAPASNAPNVKHLYITDRAVDNNTNPNENDGKIYEVTLGAACGNGLRETGEACDGSDLGGANCASQGCSGGTPSCTAACALSYASCSGCPACGNGVREGGELCDGADLGGQTCQSRGFLGGTLLCSAGCAAFDTTGCVLASVVEVRVTAGSDDAEESATGSVSLTSSDLELVFDGSNQIVGLRFGPLPIPRGTGIANAWVQFKADEAQSEPTILTIQGQAAGNAATFASSSLNLSSRLRTAAAVAWPQPPATSIPAWGTVGAFGPDQRTPNLASIVQEIVSRPDWTSGNALVLLFSGTGHRTAEAVEGDAAGAPLLHVELVTAVCGNGIRESGEQCDGADLGGASCASQGCSGGDPSCSASCTISYASCTGCAACGNGVREGAEQCDGADLGGTSCASQGCSGGDPSCSASCTISYASCTGCPACGNGVREGAELCDGTDLAGQSCTTLGFGSGALACRSDCSGFDSSGCSVCDLDGVCDPQESCQSCPAECTNCGPPDLLFADGFESGTLSAWSAAVSDGGDLAVGPAAAIAGNHGLAALIDDNVAIYVQDNTPAAEARYRARFYFDPNSIAMTSGEAHYLFYGLDAASSVVARLELRSYQGDYQIRGAIVNDVAGTTNSAWILIRDQMHFVEIDWRAATAAGANDGGLTLWLDGEQRANLGGIDNDTRRIDAVRLGAVSGIDAGTRGTYIFDAFESRRATSIGPDSTAPPPPPPAPLPPSIFSDGFESGGLSAWSQAATDLGDLSVSAASALAGGFGLSALLDDNNAITVTDWSPRAERHYRASFLFDPNSIAMGNNESHYIFYGLQDASSVMLRLELRFASGGYQLRLGTLGDGGSWSRGAWVPIADVQHLVELDWRAASAAGALDGTLALWVDGTQVTNLSGIDNDTRAIDLIRLGAVSGVDAGTRGSYFFDSFASLR